MKLIIRQYLQLLKESGELDALLPELLLAMDLEPISGAQVGTRQDGVDVAAVGLNEKRRKTIYLFVIKRGDIGRGDWDSGQNSIRPTLNEIDDVYLRNRLTEKEKKLPKKIIVCTGGEIKQDVEPNWKAYVDQHEVAGEKEYDFWGANKLSILIEKHLFNEQMVPNDFQAKLRRVLALLSDPDYDLADFYFIVNALLVDDGVCDFQKASTRRKVIKKLRTIHLCQNIVFYWAKDEGNLKPGILCSERCVLVTWDFIRRHSLYKRKKITKIFYEIYDTLCGTYYAYFSKTYKHSYVKNGITGYTRDNIQECLKLFEHIGFLGLTGTILLNEYFLTKDEKAIIRANEVADVLKSLITNNLSSRTPCYDEHIIEISICIFVLALTQNRDFVDDWIKSMVNAIGFAYVRLGRRFPIQTDSFDDLVALNISQAEEKEKLFQLSTLLPTLAHWCIVLELNDAYISVKDTVDQCFPDCDLQIWYPDDDTDENLYTGNATNTGALDAPIMLLDSTDEMKDRIGKVQKNTIHLKKISSIQRGGLYLPFVASRHFRTPFLPQFWQSFLSINEGQPD